MSNEKILGFLHKNYRQWFFAEEIIHRTRLSKGIIFKNLSRLRGTDEIKHRRIIKRIFNNKRKAWQYRHQKRR